MRLSDLGEFRLLDQIIAELAGEEAEREQAASESKGPGAGAPADEAGASIVIGPGDDAAAIDIAVASSPGDLLLLATDMMVEGTHFLPVARLSTAHIRDVGYKSVAANISDMAAMGGSPLHILMSIAAPGDMEAALLKELMAGARQCAEEFGAHIVGGDLTRSPQLTNSVAITGRAPRDRIAGRGGARPGDLIFVTGTLGDSAAGLSLIGGADRPSLSREDADYLIARHMRPSPRVAEAAIFTEAGVKAMIDISDGLLQDLGHICRQSAVGAKIDPGAIPMSPSFVRWNTSGDPESLAASGGEDYELIAICSPGEADLLRKEFAQRSATNLSLVGVIIESPKDTGLIDAGHLAIKGWDSFSNE